MEEQQRAAAPALLVVDDEEQVRLVLRRQLERLGYSVVVTGDAPSALAELNAVATRFEAVLIDLTLPEMDGVMLAQAIQQQKPDLPLLLMSGFHATELHTRVERLAIAGFLQKPFTLADLRGALDLALKGGT